MAKKSNKIIAIIPARGGSKGIPEKNIKNFCGKPLIAWTIEEALKSKMVDRVIVSTDSQRIAAVARKYGAETPFMQPSELARSGSRLEDVLRYAITWLLKNEGYCTDAVALLLPTNPLRQARHIDGAIKIFFDKKTDSVIAASELPAAHNPYWVFEPSKKRAGTFDNAVGQNINDIPPRRQLLPKYYTKNDIVFVIKPKNLLGKKPALHGLRQELYTMSDFYDADINTPNEWLMTEIKFKMLRSEANKKI